MDYVKFLCDLIAIDTTVPPGRNYEKAIDFMMPYFKQVGFTAEKVAIPKTFANGNEGRFALIAHRRNALKPRLIFYSHVDVVPAEGWDAFTPKVDGGKILGRGAADMKGCIAALLVALELVRQSDLNYDVSVIVTTDEEVGQADQIRYLGQFLQPANGACVWSLDSFFGFVVVATLGDLAMDIKVSGKSVHSAMSDLGENAVEKAFELVNALLELKKKVAARKSSVLTEPDTGLTRMVPRLNINMIKGGLKVNIVPDECTISIDRRLIPEEKIEDAEKEIMDALGSVKGVQWKVEKVTMRIPTVPPLNEDPVTEKLSKIIKDVTGKTGLYGQMGSGDFGPIIVNEWKAKKFGTGVIRADENIHGKNEFVRTKDIEDLAEIIVRFLKTA